jgi:hypothetical protein
MKLPLLIGARPQVCKRGPMVHLIEGTWRVVVENVSDSVLRFHYHSQGSSYEQVMNGKELEFKGPCKLYVEIDKPGSERDINVFAELAHA